MIGKRKHPMLNVAQHIMYSFRWTIILYWLIYIVVFVGIGILTNSGVVTGSDFKGQEAWDATALSPKIFLLVIGILLTTISLAGFVSSGVTRRYFVGGVSLVLIIFSAIFALLMTAFIPLEQFIYNSGEGNLELGELGRKLFEYFCLFFTFFGSGWLIGSGFYRFNWQIGVLISLAALLPPLIMEVVLSPEWIDGLQQSVFEVERFPLVVVGLLAILIMASTVVLNFMMLRRVAIKKRLF